MSDERIRLRPVQPDDAEPYVQAFADDPDLARLVGFDAPSMAAARAARGRGVGLAALRLITRWALDVLGLQRVGLATIESNEATKRLAERAGYEREGVLRAFPREWGRPVDNVIHSVVA